MALARADIIQFLRAGEKIVEDEALRASAKDHVDHLLNMAAGVGLLVEA